jgi:hypothetical protein
MTLTHPPGDFKHYLFDCDGTNFDSIIDIKRIATRLNTGMHRRHQKTTSNPPKDIKNGT